MSLQLHPAGAMRISQDELRAARDLAEDALDRHGRLRVMPAAFYASSTRVERALFGQRHGLYGFPTTELVDWLRHAIDGRRAIEIGAGSGVLAEALGIPATDSMLQQDPLIAQAYAAAGQPPVRYGANVRALDAAAAVAHFQPQVVIACWVTHKWLPTRPEAEGNMFGVDEEAVIANCDTYIFIGNTHVHRGKSVWNLAHERIEPDWLFSRAFNGSADFIAVWDRARPAATITLKGAP